MGRHTGIEVSAKDARICRHIGRSCCPNTPKGAFPPLWLYIVVIKSAIRKKAIMQYAEIVKTNISLRMREI